MYCNFTPLPHAICSESINILLNLISLSRKFPLWKTHIKLCVLRKLASNWTKAVFWTKESTEEIFNTQSATGREKYFVLSELKRAKALNISSWLSTFALTQSSLTVSKNNLHVRFIRLSFGERVQIAVVKQAWERVRIVVIKTTK